MTEQLSRRAEVDPLAPWPILAERGVGAAPSAELYESVPSHLEPHLMSWVQDVIDGEDELVQRVLTRLRVGYQPQVRRSGQATLAVTPAHALLWLAHGQTQHLVLNRTIDRMTVIDEVPPERWTGARGLKQPCGVTSHSRLD
ncbi:MAG TPA: hypothetical protein VH352_22575 [Pseudonocardiaceae bacterium]|jgi:hypothetical protein|nr:hypothetical protein [Pseudonocardiaceae bacterium]